MQQSVTWMSRLRVLPQFLRFAIVGAIGFVVDGSALYVGIYLLGTGPYYGRVMSYLCSATATWYLNRTITFPDSRGQHKGKEWLTFIACSSLAGVFNYAVYAAFLHLVGQSAFTPIIGVGLGACAGLVVNYTLSRRLVFRQRAASTL
jgi:putative flippase GtrA